MRSLLTLTATALAVAGCGGGGYSSSPTDPPTTADAPPTLSAIADVTINQDTPTPAIMFTVADDRTDAASLVVASSSSDPTLIPDESIVLAGGSGNRTVTITPAEAAVGSATVSLTVEDAAGLSTTRTLLVTVNAVNVAFTPWIFDTFAEGENEEARSLLGFTLNNDSEDQPDAFDSLL
jgi:hypothetical protein